MKGPLIDFTCRWFAVTIGYDVKFDESGIWIYGPRRSYRSKNGALRWCWHLRFCYYDINGRRVWRHLPDEFPFRGGKRVWFSS